MRPVCAIVAPSLIAEESSPRVLDGWAVARAPYAHLLGLVTDESSSCSSEFPASCLEGSQLFSFYWWKNLAYGWRSSVLSWLAVFMAIRRSSPSCDGDRFPCWPLGKASFEIRPFDVLGNLPWKLGHYVALNVAWFRQLSRRELHHLHTLGNAINNNFPTWISLWFLRIQSVPWFTFAVKTAYDLLQELLRTSGWWGHRNVSKVVLLRGSQMSCRGRVAPCTASIHSDLKLRCWKFRFKITSEAKWDVSSHN
jgi:hypothetical protein